jgi:hypothetical protein
VGFFVAGINDDDDHHSAGGHERSGEERMAAAHSFLLSSVIGGPGPSSSFFPRSFARLEMPWGGMLSDLRASLRRLRASHSFGSVKVFAGSDRDRDREAAVMNDNDPKTVVRVIMFFCGYYICREQTTVIMRSYVHDNA